MTSGPPYRAISGRGEEIYRRMIGPLLREGYQYDRVTSFYDPYSLLILLRELAAIWKRGGFVRLIVGFHQSKAVVPALRPGLTVTDAVKRAVAEALRGYTEELLTLLGQESGDILSVLREMFNQHAMQVRLVTPRANIDYYQRHGTWPNPEVALFHSKFMVIHHEGNDREPRQIRSKIWRLFSWAGRRYYQSLSLRRRQGLRYSVITGSVNESVRGLTKNIEDAVLHRSWIPHEREVSEYFLKRFEEMWNCVSSDVETMPFTDEFCAVVDEYNHALTSRKNRVGSTATQMVEHAPIEARTDSNEGQDWISWASFADAVSRSPLYCALAFPYVGLLPHQIHAYVQALSRWPIRILLADEVGLGKTIEAGSIIHYLLRFGGVRRVLILTPASLMKQWQQELKKLFGLNFWVYDSRTQTCQTDLDSIQVGRKPFRCDNGINLLIMSWHWLRGDSRSNPQLDLEDMPDLLVVDEAHHARIHDDTSDGRSTRLYKLLKDMQRHIPHILLLTATPYQTNIMDYYSLLDILGVPEGFKEALDYYSRWFRGEIPHGVLSTVVTHLRYIHQFAQEYELGERHGLVGPLECFSTEKCDKDTKFYETIARQVRPLPEEVVIATHPATFLAVRSERITLSSIGYRFPTPHLYSPRINVTKEQEEFLQELEDFVSRHLAYAESYYGNRTGLVRSLYRQRIVSSIRAAVDTLRRRKEYLQSIVDRGCFSPLTGNDQRENELDSDLEYDMDASNGELSNVSVQRAKTEFYAVQRILDLIERAFQSGGQLVDPKMTGLRQILSDHVSRGRKVLVFSRYTSTTDAIIEMLGVLVDTFGVGRYDGECVGTYAWDGTRPILHECSPKDIVSLLKRGSIRVLVCSDAASEGLNLHYANEVVNVDVPWNPAMLFQRFGRVDRLGQRAKDVYLINLYYPNSIEERMYRVLEDRRTDFRAVVGQVPEILTDQQKRVISSLADGRVPIVNLTLEEIERARAEYRKNQILHADSKDVQTIIDKSPYAHLIRVIERAAVQSGLAVRSESKSTVEIEGERVSVDPVDDDFVSIGNPLLKKLEAAHTASNRTLPVRLLEDETGTPIALLIEDHSHVYPVTTRDWGKIFEFFFEDHPLDLASLRRFSKNKLAEILLYLRREESWIWPDHQRMRCFALARPEIPHISGVRVGENLGYISVR